MKLPLNIEIYETGVCPKCQAHLEYEPCSILPNVVPLCDACEAEQSDTWAKQQQQDRWKALYLSKLPKGYLGSKPEKVPSCYARALQWESASNHGGLGLIGVSGEGKSSAMACALWKLEKSFLWWSGTEARDAAIQAATADRDREGANRRWEHAMRVPVLVLDDVSQGKLTEAWSSKLFDILETRLSNGLPTFWTCQISIAELKEKIIRQNSGDVAQAEAITRRLSQHSLVLRA